MVKNAATVAAVAALCCQSAMSFSTVGGATHKRPRAQVACNVQQQQYEYPIPSLPRKEQVPSRKSVISSWVSSDEVPLDDRRRSKLLSFPVEADGLRNVDQRIVAEIIKDPKIEVIDTFLVLLSCFLAAVSTSNTVDLKTMAQIIRVENVIAYMFAAEFFVRWFSDFSWKGILGYLSRPLVLVDILVVIVPLLPIIIPNNAEAYNILPSWLTSTSGLINLRLLRVLRLQRVLQSMDTFAEFTEALGYEKTEIKPYKLQLARVVISVFTLLSISSGLIYTTEHNVNPDIPDYFTALYFGLTTLTTVGFGDIVVISPEGRFVVCASILAGGKSHSSFALDCVQPSTFSNLEIWSGTIHFLSFLAQSFLPSSTIKIASRCDSCTGRCSCGGTP